MNPENFYRGLSGNMKVLTYPDNKVNRVLELLHLAKQYLDDTEVQDQEIVWLLGNLERIARDKPQAKVNTPEFNAAYLDRIAE